MDHMNFSSISRSSNFSQAGKSAADETVKAFAASRRNAPKYDKMAEDAVKMRSKEKIAAMKAEQEVALAGIKAKSNVKSHEIKNQAQMKRDKAKRKAGALGVAGKMFGQAGQFLDEPRAKREVGSEDSWYDSQIQSTKDSYTKYADLLNDDGTLKDTSTSTSTSTAGGNDSGKGTSSTATSGGGATTSTLTDVQTTGLKAIREVESGPYGYDAYNLGGRTEFEPVGSGSATDGRFGKPLTQMTIGEIKQLGQSGKIHATGAYQFTHNTGSFGEAATFAGLSDNDLFTPTNQDAMALAFGQKYGWERWSGLKNDSGRAQLAQLAFQ